jgi:hypothetical protein
MKTMTTTILVAARIVGRETFNLFGAPLISYAEATKVSLCVYAVSFEGIPAGTSHTSLVYLLKSNLPARFTVRIDSSSESLRQRWPPYIRFTARLLRSSFVHPKAVPSW